MELYLDDCIVYGTTEAEFEMNLRAVFERFRAHNITLNPEKCKFGLSSIEYLGHIFDQKGIHFSREKIDKVLNFETPVVVKDLMSFMGLVNYFGDHLPHLADELRILREMEKECRVTKKLRWTDQRRQRFQRVKEIVNEMQELFFLNDTDTVRIYTDASGDRYAIGGCVCQVFGDKERPVGFMSKTLTTTAAQMDDHGERMLRDIHDSPQI